MKALRLQKFVILTLWALAATLPAYGGISYTCDATVAADGPAGLCNFINTTIAGLYSSTFTAASLGNVNLYVQYGSTGLASSTQYIINTSYKSYVDALAAHEGDANDVTAVGSLGGDVTNPVAAGDNIGLTSALASSLGLAGATGIHSGTLATCVLGSASCYNGIITVTNALSNWYYRSLSVGAQGGSTYDFFTALEHETDEMLGTTSCISGVNTLSCTNGGTGISPGDLFRYVGGSGTRSTSATANGSAACFSINGGTTDVACYNNQPGADYGDWDGASNRVQNAFGTPGTNGVNITNDGGSEIALLDAVGFNLNSQAAPEPATFGLLGASLAAVGIVARRRRQN